MATYPTGVFAPAAKSNGQTIQASFDNDQDAEITAIEDGLKNGLQHPLTVTAGDLTVSSGAVVVAAGVQTNGPSSLGSLQVNGGSTFADGVVCSSNLTVGGDLTVTGSIGLPRRPVARVTHSTSTELANNTWVGLSFDTDRIATPGLHSTGANSSRLNLTSSGLWSVGVNLEFAANNQSYRHARLLVNDSTNTCIAEVSHWNANGNPDVVNLTTLYYATSTTAYVTAQVFQGSGSTLRIIVHAQSSPEFWAVQVSS